GALRARAAGAGTGEPEARQDSPDGLEPTARRHPPPVPFHAGTPLPRAEPTLASLFACPGASNARANREMQGIRALREQALAVPPAPGAFGWRSLCQMTWPAAGLAVRTL